MKPGERLAVIDLGSNSFRLVVFMAGDGWWKRTDEIYEPVRIGEGLAGSGRLGERADGAGAGDARRVRPLLPGQRAGRGDAIDAVATSAIRDAENAEGFLRRARERLRLPIRVLSREEEARYGYLAAVNSTTLGDGCVLDLGGGSMQLVRVADRLARESGSWRVGTVRMSERFLPANGPAKRRQIEALREHVAAELARAAGGSPRAGRGAGGWRAPGGDRRDRAQPRRGGPARRRAAVQRRAGDGARARGARRARAAPRGAAGRRARERARHQAGARRPDPGRRGGRAGRAAGRRLRRPRRRPRRGCARASSSSGCSRSSADLRSAPLFEDVRRASVLNLAGQYHVDAAHTRHVAALALGMFDELARLGLHDGDARERELLWAASMLHDIGMSVDYDDHHKHSRYLILNAGLPGFSPVEVAIIAQAARYHRKGMPEPGPLARAVRRGRRGAPGSLRGAAAPGRGPRALARPARARHAHRAARSTAVELRLIADGESVVPRWAANRETRAVRARLPPRAGRGRLRPLGRRRGVVGRSPASPRRLQADASARSRPAQSNRISPLGVRGRASHCRVATTRQARCTAAVAPLPPRVENSPPSTT